MRLGSLKLIFLTYCRDYSLDVKSIVKSVLNVDMDITGNDNQDSRNLKFSRSQMELLFKEFENITGKKLIS